MKRVIALTSLAALTALILSGASAFPQSAATIADIQRQFREPPADSRIMLRWWWFGPSVTRDELDREMRAMKEGGIGGFEVATVYPLALDDPAHGMRNYGYLSDEFLDKVTFAARRAKELGLRMDVTVGSGWSYGGPYITPLLAATRLRSERREIAPDVISIARPQPYEHDRLVAAFVGRGSLQEVDARTFREIDIGGSGPLRLPAGDGPRALLLYFSSPTGQVVKRAAAGAEGYVLDHYNRAAIDMHLREAGDKLIAAAGPGGVYSVFCDSLEVYEAGWTADLLAEFQTRRGYDLRPLLPLAEFGTGERAESVRRDYGRTLTELFEDRFLKPMHDWSARHQVRFRIQNYGVPPAALASYRHADIFDGEGFEWRALSASRWAASAAHLFGKPIASSETWTWLHSPAFRATPLDLKAEGDLHFLSGINQLIGHGWPYSPPQAGSPGWMFYAAGVFSDKNPWWPVMPDVSRYLQRVSFLLRQGQPVADVALYLPTDDAWSLMRPGVADRLNLWSTLRDRVGPRVIPAILDAGHAFDLIDDRTLNEAAARGYRAVVLPAVVHMPDATRAWLEQFKARGGQVLERETLSGRLPSAVPPDVAFEPLTPELGFAHRQLDDGDVYFVANTGNARRTVRARFRGRTAAVERWDAMTGAVERLALDGEQLPLTFEPYGSQIIVFRKQPSTAPATTSPNTIDAIELRSGWRTGPASQTIELPYSWTDQPAQRFFSGTVSFERTLDIDASWKASGTKLVLDFGAGVAVEREALPGGTMRGNSFAALLASPVREAATVFVNGRRAGSVWAPPYRVDVTDFIRPGANALRIDVYNTAINQLAEGGRLPDVNALVERYGQRFRLQDLDNLQPIPSGILAGPRLVVER